MPSPSSMNFVAPCVVLLLAAAVGSPVPAQHVVLSDFGAQPTLDAAVELGSDFGRVPYGIAKGNSVGSKAAEFLIPMPAPAAMDVDHQGLYVDKVATALNRRIEWITAGREPGLEIQLLRARDPSTKGEARAVAFGNAVLRALDRVIATQHAAGRNLSITATFGGDSTTLFVRNVAAWRPFAARIHRVDLVQGHSLLFDTRDAIATLGSSRVRLFVIRGAGATNEGELDAPALSIGRADGALRLVNEFPGLVAYTLERAAGEHDAVPHHVAGMAGHNRTFRVTQQVRLRGEVESKTLARELTPQSFRDPVTGWDPAHLATSAEHASALGYRSPAAMATVATAAPPAWRLASEQQTTAAIPGIWILSAPDADTADELPGADALIDYATGAQRVVVVGTGEATRELGDRAEAAFGKGNVVRMDAAPMLEVQSRARGFGADLVLGQAPLHDLGGVSGQRVLVSARSALSVATSLRSLFESGKKLQEIKLDPVSALNFPKVAQFGDIKRVVDLADAIHSDIRAHQRGNYSLLTSRTLETVGTVGIDVAPRVAKIVTGISRTRDVARYASGTGLVPALKAASRLADSGGRLDLGTIELGLDAVSDLTAFAAGYTECAARAAVSPLARNPKLVHEIGMEGGLATQKGAKAVRDLARPATQGAFDAIAGVGARRRELADKTVDNYVAVQLNRAQRGERVQDFPSWMGSQGRGARDGGVSAKRGDDAYMHVLSRMSSTQATEARRLTVNAGVHESESSVLAKTDMAIRAMPQDTDRRVLVVGQGACAEAGYQRLAARYGAANVRWETAQPGSIAARRAEADFCPSDVLALKENKQYAASRQVSAKPEMSLAPRAPRDLDFCAEAGRRPMGKDLFSQRLLTSPSLDTKFTMSKVPDIGGVMLNATAAVEGDQGLHGSNFGIVFTNPEEGVDIDKLRRFTTALWCVYLGRKDPGISIDPKGKHENTHKVVYFGHVYRSDIGRVMRECDYLMKHWAVGADRPDVPGFLTPEEFSLAIKVERKDVASRFWFVPSGMVFRQASSALLFKDGRMIVKTEYVGAGMKDKTDPANEKFAQWLTDNYRALALRYPVFEEMFDYAKCVSLAKHLKARGVPMLWFLLANHHMLLADPDPRLDVPLLHKQSDYEWWVEIYGGVDLGVKMAEARYVADKRIADELTVFLGDPGETAGRLAGESVVVRDGDVALSFVPSQDVSQTAMGGAGEVFQTDLFLRAQEHPRLELVRFFDPSSPEHGVFGRGWHLGVPFHLSYCGAKQVRHRTANVPDKITIRHLLTDRRETLWLDQEQDEVRYLPDKAAKSIFVAASATASGFLVKDKLGSGFAFTLDGRLAAAHLSPDYRLSFHYKTYEMRLQRVPAAPRLEGIAPGAKSLVLVEPAMNGVRRTVFASADGTGAPGVFQASADEGIVRQISSARDGRYILIEETGRRLVFDRDGQCEQLVRTVPERITNDTAEIVLDYEWVDGHLRVARAQARQNGVEVAGADVRYEYADEQISAVTLPGGERRRLTYGDSGRRVEWNK